MAHYDLFVIGGGSGGVACARRSASYGAKIGIAESSRFGGTCVIRGCVPKKLMHYSAHFAHHFHTAKSYGWQTGESRLGFAKLIQARNAEIQRLNNIYITMLDKAGVTMHPGRAILVEGSSSHHTIEVDGEQYTANRVLIAVGGRPMMPEIPGIEHAVTSDFVLEEVYDIPKRLAVVGAGYIGVEIASIFAGFGVDTTMVLRRDRPLRGFDDDLRQELTDQLQLNGLNLMTETVVERIEKQGDVITLVTDKGPLETDMLVYATGRKPIPNTADMGLKAAGVVMEEDGSIPVGDDYQTNVPTIYAVGDCSNHDSKGLDSGQFDLTPVAIAEGRAIAETLFNNNPHTVAYDTVPTAIFGIPQGGSVGMNEAQAKAAGYDIQVFKTRFRPMLQSFSKSEDRVFMKLVVDKASDKVLGCFMVGDEAGEIIQGLAVALTAGATKAAFDATVGVHPSSAEEFVTMYQPAT